MFIKAKKSLGQNFLLDKNVQKKIVSACFFKPQDSVLEIGAGRGELTKLIAAKVKQVFALEIDAHLCAILKDNLRGCTNVKIIQQDILKFALNRHFRKRKSLKVIGNIPYYITTPIIEYILKYRAQIDSVFLTLQKEFAKRLTAQAGTKKYGSLSCFAQYYTEPKILFTIKRNSFRPIPKTDSSFLSLKLRDKAPFDLKDEDLFFKLIRQAFNKRRKTLRNSLKGITPLEKLEIFFRKYGISSNIRPEALSLPDFANLANI